MRQKHLSKRVANEVEIHWQLRHSSVLELYNYFEDSEYVYMVMELCENGNLYQYLKSNKNGRLNEYEARGVLFQLVNALMYLHSNGIIHRDLKLSNILLNHKNELVKSTLIRNWQILDLLSN
jgi:serine/threonine protein kinase